VTARGDGAGGRRGGVTSARGDGAGLPRHQYGIGDIVKLKGDRVTLWKVTQLLDTSSGTGYMVVPVGNGAFRAVKDDKVTEKVYTAQEWAEEMERR
jgi:hypothetical protein